LATSAALPTKSRGDLQVDRPGEAGVERRNRLVHVLAVEVHAGFEAQRVAGAEAAGLDAGAASLCQSLGLLRAG
jgi:hypothetical protein